MIERIKLEFAEQLKGKYHGNFELGYIIPSKPNNVTFLPTDVRIGECNLEDKKTILVFMNPSEIEKQEKYDDEAYNSDPMPFALEGFLSKEGVNRITRVKLWKRRWFCTQENRLIYYANRNGGEPSGGVQGVPDMDIQATPIPGNNKLFELRSPKRTYRLEAMNPDDVELWVSGLNSILMYYNKHQSVIKVHKEGVLFKRGGPLKNWKKRHCVLRSDALYYYTGEGQQMKGKIPLLHVTVDDFVYVDKPFAFYIITASKRYVLCATSEEEMKEWVRLLREQARVATLDVDAIEE